MIVAIPILLLVALACCAFVVLNQLKPPAPCERLDEFYDGQMPEEDRPWFRRHLGECQQCQAELHDYMQFGARIQEVARRRGDRFP